MSVYSTIAAISESPLDGDILIAGTDDGLVQVTGDGGATWRRAAALPGVSERAFMNDVKASQHDPATLFVVAPASRRSAPPRSSRPTPTSVRPSPTMRAALDETPKAGPDL